MVKLSAEAEGGDDVALWLMIGSGFATVVFGGLLSMALMKVNKKRERLAEESEPELVDAADLDPGKFPGGYVSVYYASQTGTAEFFGKQIERESEQKGFKVRLVDLEDVDEADIAGHLCEEKFASLKTRRNVAIFLVATYGEGEPTDNAAAFVASLRTAAGLQSNIVTHDEPKSQAEEKKLEADEDPPLLPDLLRGKLDYAVFGLGNRQYEHFNAQGKLMDHALRRVGGEQMVPLGLGDDDNDIEADFESWKDHKMWPTLSRLVIGDVSFESTKTDCSQLPPCPYQVEYLSGVNKLDPVSLEDVHTSTRHYFTASDCPVVASRELRSSGDDGSTVHVEIDISKVPHLVYNTADNLGVLPVNEPSVVEAVASSLSYDLEAVFRLKQCSRSAQSHSVLFPSPCTVRDFLGRYCDLTSAPRRSDLKMLAAFASDPLDKSALLRMASKEGKDEYREKILESHVGFAQIICNLCRSIEIPLQQFVALCPRMLPRYYTISSSSSVHPSTVHITVSVVTSKRKDGSVFRGVCSHHLSRMLRERGAVRVFCRDSSFRLPADPSKPILMIGPGSGVAPMRALLQERSHQANTERRCVGPNVLYFGCKRRDMDFLYKDELEAYQKDGLLSKLYLAFSREGASKVYVQHLIAKNAEETWKLIDSDGAYVYVCGGVKMGADVSEALRNLVASKGRKSPEAARKYLEELTDSGRYVQELWA